ncbi:hypothetical protein [Nodularia chucula]|uniref:hypothetical protein n=1 Tax=Nodularia chucula TaxID=3093667 RepID=UPI0039C5EC6E
MNHPILILILAMLAGALYLAWLVIDSHQSAQRRYRRTTRKSPKPKLKQRVNSSTKGKLLRMVRGDEDLAYRLVRQVKASFPNQSDQWCWEKAIWDLERDRN